MYITEVQESGKEHILIVHSSDNSESKSKILTAQLPGVFFDHFSGMNLEFQEMCPIDDRIKMSISGFKLRDTENGTQIQFTTNLRTAYLTYDKAKSEWLDFREIDTSQLGGNNLTYRNFAQAMNRLVVKFNEFQRYIEDNIATWLQFEDNQLSLFETRLGDAVQRRKAETSIKALERYEAALSVFAEA